MGNPESKPRLDNSIKSSTSVNRGVTPRSQGAITNRRFTDSSLSSSIKSQHSTIKRSGLQKSLHNRILTITSELAEKSICMSINKTINSNILFAASTNHICDDKYILISMSQYLNSIVEVNNKDLKSKIHTESEIDINRLLSLLEKTEQKVTHKSEPLLKMTLETSTENMSIISDKGADSVNQSQTLSQNQSSSNIAVNNIITNKPYKPQKPSAKIIAIPKLTKKVIANKSPPQKSKRISVSPGPARGKSQTKSIEPKERTIYVKNPIPIPQSAKNVFKIDLRKGKNSENPLESTLTSSNSTNNMLYNTTGNSNVYQKSLIGTSPRNLTVKSSKTSVASEFINNTQSSVQNSTIKSNSESMKSFNTTSEKSLSYAEMMRQKMKETLGTVNGIGKEEPSKSKFVRNPNLNRSVDEVTKRDKSEPKNKAVKKLVGRSYIEEDDGDMGVNHSTNNYSTVKMDSDFKIDLTEDNFDDIYNSYNDTPKGTVSSTNNISLVTEKKDILKSKLAALKNLKKNIKQPEPLSHVEPITKHSDNNQYNKPFMPLPIDKHRTNLDIIRESITHEQDDDRFSHRRNTPNFDQMHKISYNENIDYEDSSPKFNKQGSSDFYENQKFSFNNVPEKVINIINDLDAGWKHKTEF